MGTVFDSPSPETTDPGVHLHSSKYGDVHRHHRRLFIGPMPLRVFEDKQHSLSPAARPWYHFFDSESDGFESESYIGGAVEDYTRQYFLRHGGREDDWGEEQQRSIRRQLSENWRESEWGRALRRLKRKERTPVPWVGNTFEVGDFVGVNILDGESLRDPSSSGISRPPDHTNSDDTGHPLPRPSAVTTNTGETSDTFITARTEFSTPEAPSTHEHSSPDTPKPTDDPAPSANSSTALLSPPMHRSSTTRTESAGTRSALRIPGFPRTHSDDTAHGKSKKAVRVHIIEPVREATVPPEEVLDRSGPEIEETSAAAMRDAQPAVANTLTPVMESAEEGVIMRDRMLVRISLTKDPSIGARFDEEANRVAQHMEAHDWSEQMVVWRPGKIELYEDYSIPFKERVVGHKRLAYTIPLRTAKLTLYSFVDLSFCIACPAADSHNSVRNHLLPIFRMSSTSIFVFKAKNRSRATDWVFHLWRTLGGQLPPYVEVRSPVMGLSLKVDVPSVDNNTDFAIFSHDNLVSLCRRTLGSMPDWRYILEKRLADGAKLELAWRSDTSLDWVWWSRDMNGKSRDWAVLAGLALNQPGKQAQLEIRIGEHFPSLVHLHAGTHLYEPPPVEGYVSRVRPRSRQLQEVYLTVHDGLLFTLAPSRAQAPGPPGSIPAPSPDPTENYFETLRTSEVRRGARQIANARGVTDLRAVLVVRRAFQVIPEVHEHIAEASSVHTVDDARLHEAIEMDSYDELDTGGEEGLQRRGGDRAHGHMRRCFELVMKTGEIVRFEAYTANNAIEWIEHLRALIRYWRLRHLASAQEEMDVVHFAMGKPLITPRRHAHEECRQQPPEPLANPGVVLPYLSSLYHWCVFESCRPVTKTGRIYIRQGLKGKYQLFHLFLVDGHLVQFRIGGRPTFHPRHGKVVNLIDAYVVSGILAARALPAGEYKPNAPTVARRYRDGLESDDRDEDTLLVVLYYPHTFQAGMGAGRATMPSLSAERKMLVLRARSKVERDLWCWALNTEIEKVSRKRMDREEALRMVGKVYKWVGDQRRREPLSPGIRAEQEHPDGPEERQA